ncbi:MAG: ribonuclease Z [Spirochaetales bacterium]|nr:ribonuclease Z [Spirochaetales bacterium]
MTMEAFILGTGGMMPLPGRSLTSVLLRREGELLLFDCGEGTQVSIRRLNLRWKKISVIFISHTHADHVTGIPGILMLSSQVEREEPLYIIGPPNIKEYIEQNCRILEMYINYKIIIKEIRNPGIVYEGDGYKVRAFWLCHSRPCMGYTIEEDIRPGVFYPEKARSLNIPMGPLWARLQNGDKVNTGNGSVVCPGDVMGPARKGRKVGFVTDTAYKPGISGNVKGADLFICEGMFAEEMEKDAFEKKHLTSRQAALIAKEAGVKKMGIIHYSPRYSYKELTILLKEAKAVFPDTFLTKDCQSIIIPYGETPYEEENHG